MSERVIQCDYVVIGSGSAGAVVAARLAEKSQRKVVCLEAGSQGAHYPFTIPPAGSAFMYGDPKVNWCYLSEANETHGDREIYAPRGKLMGGTSAINGTVYNRGQRVDYDTWAQMGNRGWDYDSLVPIFKRIESANFGSEQYHGRSGPIKVTEATPLTPFYDLFFKSAEAVGIPYNVDYSGETMDGVALAQHTVSRGIRQGTANRYLEPARKKYSNLNVVKGAEATQLIIEGKRCVGVRALHRGRPIEIRAALETIVSCGAANSPKLLELSGIGNPEILERHGIPVVHALPGVGENLRDHYGPVMRWRFKEKGLSLADKGHGLNLVLETLRYFCFQDTFIGQCGGPIRVFTRSRPELSDPDVSMIVAPYIMDLTPSRRPVMSSTQGFTMWCHVQRTESTGSVHVRSADPLAAPRIDFRFMATEGERQATFAAVRKARQIVAASPLADTIAEELLPGANVQSDEDLMAYIDQWGAIMHHMSGTCKMGHDPLAVVDDRLRVHGIEGLRIADASIMPTIPSGNTSVPCMMVGERCADMIIEDAQ